MRKHFSYGMTNEGGCENKISFLKNIVGLWMIQESRRQWMREGQAYSFGELEDMAKSAKPFLLSVRPGCTDFSPGRKYAKKNSKILSRERTEHSRNTGSNCQRNR